MMPEQVPQFNDASLTRLVRTLYGMEGELSPLVSYEDQNALLTTATGRYVLKIANTKWPPAFLQLQTDVLAYLKATTPELTFPGTIPTLQGGSITYIDGFAVRLLTYLDGELLAKSPRTPELYQDIGRFMGQFSTAMQHYVPAVTEGSDVLWQLDNVLACKAYLADVNDSDTRDRMVRLYGMYEEKIRPRLPHLRKALIHGDANEQNILVAPDTPMHVAGLIDFGEVQWASQVNELAITLAYALLGEQDIGMASEKIIAGYDREFALEDEERDILYDLMAMRLVTSITMTSHSAKLFPENTYITISQKPALVLLKRLEEEGYILA